MQCMFERDFNHVTEINILEARLDDRDNMYTCFIQKNTDLSNVLRRNIAMSAATEYNTDIIINLT